jgi:hypothetical protein
MDQLLNFDRSIVTEITRRITGPAEREKRQQQRDVRVEVEAQKTKNKRIGRGTMRIGRKLTEDEDDDKPRAPRKNLSLQSGTDQPAGEVGSTEVFDTKRKPSDVPASTTSNGREHYNRAEATLPVVDSRPSSGPRNHGGTNLNMASCLSFPAAVARARAKDGYAASVTSNTVAGAVSVSGNSASTTTTRSSQQHQQRDEQLIPHIPPIVAELATVPPDVSQLVEERLQGREQHLRRELEELVRREQRETMVEAVEVLNLPREEPPAVQPSHPATRKSVFWTLALCVLLIVGGAVWIALGVPRAKKSTDTNNATAPDTPITGAPTVRSITNAPSTAPTTSLRLRSFVQILEKYVAFPTDISSLDPDSPQSQALLWLVNDDLYIVDPKLVSAGQILERYALAVMYFSTRGRQWRNGANFMNATASVCDWLEHSDPKRGVIECDDNGSVTWIEFCKC